MDSPFDKRIATVGRVHPHAECKVVDDAGDVVPIGVEGERHTYMLSSFRNRFYALVISHQASY